MGLKHKEITEEIIGAAFEVRSLPYFGLRMKKDIVRENRC